MRDTRGFSIYFEDEDGENHLVETTETYHDFDFNDVTEIKLVDGRVFKIIIKNQALAKERREQFEEAMMGKKIYDSIKRDRSTGA